MTQSDEIAKDTNVLTMMIANDINVVTKNDENAKEGGNLMFDLIHELYTILNKIKGFKAGYSSSVDNRIIIDYKTKRYIITLDEIENPSSDITDDIKRFA